MCFGVGWTATSMSICALVGVLCVTFGVDYRIAAMPVFLFVKEWIQYQTYQDLRCNRRNEILSTMSWIHISFQPLIVNLFLSYFAKDAQKEYRIVLWLCGIFAVFNMARLRELRGRVSKPCHAGAKDMCRATTCSYMGQRHIAYGFNLQSADDMYAPSWFTYLLLSFAPALILGPRVLGMTHMAVAILGGVLARGYGGEGAAIWCLNSFWVCFVALYVLFGER